MKLNITIILAIFAALTACNDLDLNPLSEGSSENWFSNELEFEMAVNALYYINYWYYDDEAWTDNWTNRNTLTEITGGTINGEWNQVTLMWTNAYEAIARANVIITEIEKGVSENIPQATINRIDGEARFVRAAQYSRLISHFGDVVYYTESLSPEEAFEIGRTDKNTVLQEIYNDFDIAAEKLPTEYAGSELVRATKGAALAMKARIALYNSDWAVAKEAAKACMDLGVYELYPDFQELFLSKTIDHTEVVFSIPCSEELGVLFAEDLEARIKISRNAGGYGSRNPSWDLFASFLCNDGLPIDESPYFDPREPFKNRDPRCTANIVEFQTEHLGYMYQPHPDSLYVLNFNTGKLQYNNDTRSTNTYASYTGLLWKKWIDEDWIGDFKAENNLYVIRYADVLLMYAEAKIELNEIDQSVLDAINRVRARAYKVEKHQIILYPSVRTTDQTELRKILRIERRMELAWEGTRYMDIIRWGIAHKVLNRNNYGMLDPEELREKVVKQGLWFWPETPQRNIDGLLDFTSMYDQGLIKLLTVRKFDASKQYLWPIPTKEILINDNLKQNPGY